MSISDLAYASLEQAVNQHISMDPNARAEMAQLHGQVVALEILGTGQTIYLAPGPEIVQLYSSYEGEPDCLLQGSPLAIAQLRTKIPEGETAVPDDMKATGDITLAEKFCHILRQVDIDWEAHISQFTGSLIASEIGKVVNFAEYWGDHVVTTLKKEMQELLQDEASALPSRHDIAGFGTKVDELTDQLNKLQKRVDTLKNHKNSKGATN